MSINATITRVFTADEAGKALAFMEATKGVMAKEGEVFIVTCSIVAAAKVGLSATGVAIAKGADTTADTTGKVATATVEIAGSVVKSTIKASAPVVGAVGVAGVEIGASVVNATSKAVGDVKTAWKADPSVQEAKAEMKAAYASIKSSIPKEYGFMGIKIRF